MPFLALPLSDYAAPWCSGLTRLPVKEEIGSSNLLGVATSLPKSPRLQFVASRPTLQCVGSNTMKIFEAAYPFADDVLALPVKNIDTAAKYCADAFGLTEVERHDNPVKTVIMERDGTRIGFAVNGGDQTKTAPPSELPTPNVPKTKSKPTASKPATGESTNATARNSKSSS